VPRIVHLPQLSAHNTPVMPLFTSESWTPEFCEASFHALKAKRTDGNSRRPRRCGRQKANAGSHGQDHSTAARPLVQGDTMTAGNDRFNHQGILLPRVIECPVCGERAPSFRIRRVMDLRTVDGEFYHRTATCAGSITPDMPAAMDLLRLAVEEAAKLPEPRVQIE
jgi:hypothetical protein